MRTTVRLDENLLKDVKVYATEHGQTLTAVLERALRELLARSRAPASRVPVELPSFRGEGLRSGVDIDSSAALLELMESRPDPA